MHRMLRAWFASIALAVLIVAPISLAQERDTLISIWDGVYTAGQAERGKATFDLNCSRCHNSDLSGSDRGPTLSGDRFQANWMDGSLEALFNLIRDAMPQGNASTVSDAGKADVLAYILQTNGFPPGATELTADGAGLDLVQIVQKGTTPSLQNFSFVQVVGCLEPGSDTRWVLTRSTTRPGTRQRDVSAAELERARARPLGEDTYTLVSAAPFDPFAKQGHKVAAKGLLYRQPGGNRLNLTALETLEDNCSTGR